MAEIIRRCSRTPCQREATCTLTYAYADSTVVIGPLATRMEPHAYDLCAIHAARLTAPRGWEIVRVGQENHEGAEEDSQGDGVEISPDVAQAGAAPATPGGEPRLHVLHGQGPRS